MYKLKIGLILKDAEKKARETCQDVHLKAKFEQPEFNSGSSTGTDFREKIQRDDMERDINDIKRSLRDQEFEQRWR